VGAASFVPLSSSPLALGCLSECGFVARQRCRLVGVASLVSKGDVCSGEKAIHPNGERPCFSACLSILDMLPSCHIGNRTGSDDDPRVGPRDARLVHYSCILLYDL
jgi:hypothetical protein